MNLLKNQSNIYLIKTMISTDFEKRRKSLMKKIQSDSAVIVFSEEEKTRNNDVTYKFRQSSNFFYLTGINSPRSVLIIIKAKKCTSTILACKKPNDFDKIWHGQVPSKQSIKKKYNIQNVIYDDELNTLNLHDIKNIYFEFKDEHKLDFFLSDTNMSEPVSRYKKNNNTKPSKIDLSSKIYEMRLIKSAHEISEIRHAAKISAKAHINIMTSCKPGLTEYQIESNFINYCMTNRCDQAYPAIVASGNNACILHYTHNNSTLRSNKLLLVDAAAEYNNYASDITRTIPISGKFNRYQRIIYNIVLKSQTMAIESCKPGKTLIDVHNVAIKYITKGLIDAKILSGKLEKNIQNGTYKKYFMHNTGHWLGLDVHDPCPYVVHGKPVVLKPGMIFTVEPGIYINRDRTIDSGFHNIGIRIEDDVLITKKGCDVLTKDVPKSVVDIENVMNNV